MGTSFLTTVEWIDGKTYVLQRFPTSRKVVPSKLQREREFGALMSREAKAILRAYEEYARGQFVPADPLYTFHSSPDNGQMYRPDGSVITIVAGKKIEDVELPDWNPFE